MVVTVHHLNNSRSQSILWLMEELGVPYEIKKYQRGADMLAPKELAEVHPMGKAPVITDDGRVVAETGAIVEYLVTKYGPQLGPDKQDVDASLQYTYWLHFAEGSAMPPLVMSILFNSVGTKAPFIIRPIAKAISKGVHDAFINPNLKRTADFMEAELAKNPQNWFVRDFSAADVMLSFPVMALDQRGLLEARPKLAAWLAACKARLGWAAAMQKGGAFTMFDRKD